VTSRERLVYVTGTYPLLTTTFIDREIQALRLQGFDVDVIAARRPPRDVPLSQEQRALAAGVTYLTPISWRAVLAGHACRFVSSPVRFVSTFVYLVTRPHPSWRTRMKSCVHFAEGVHAAHIVGSRQASAIHAHFVDRAATIAFVMGRLLRLPYSVSIHAGADVFVEPVLLAEKIRHAHGVVSCTAHNKAYIESLVGAAVAGRIASIPHGLDVSRYEPGPVTDGDIPVLLAVGQLTKRKGLAQLVEACAVLRDEGRRFTCRIVGQGPEAASLRHLIRALGLEDVVTLCGPMPHERVLDEYHRATVFVLPCVRAPNGDVDGIPNVLAEAMALELPVVSSDLPAIRELVTHSATGLLVPPGDVTALAAAIRELLTHPRLRRSLGRAARAGIVDTFDVETNVQRLIDVLWPARRSEVPA
jgi:colanic acid/amylovoran biosynthesis glycosyltransferase